MSGMSTPEPTLADVMTALSEVKDTLAVHGQQIEHLTDLSLTLHNKVDANRYTVDATAGAVGAMQIVLKGLEGALFDMRQDLREHTHE